MRPLLALTALALLAGGPLRAQELDCSVRVDKRALAGNEFSFLDDLPRELDEYLNRQKWTDDRFEEYERIRCSFNITITESEGLDRFRATAVISATRPIYGSAQTTSTLQVVDSDWSFQYARGEPLVFSPTQFDDLTSFIDFYTYLILGYDYDSFEELGGDPFFAKAREISELAQGQGAAGWESIAQDRSRSTLIQQLVDPRFQPLRRAHFLYHFGGLDRFSREPEAAWENVATTLSALYDLYTEVSRRYATDVFFGAKSRELAAMLEEAPQRGELYALLIEMDGAHQQDYDRLTR